MCDIHNRREIGWLDKIHSIDARKKMSIYAASQTLSSGFKTKWYSVANIEGKFFNLQGSWERDVAIQLNKQNVNWTRGRLINYNVSHHYVPDFILSTNVIIEVKGWWKKSDLKLIHVMNEHPHLKIIIIDESNFYDFIAGKISLSDLLILTAEILQDKVNDVTV